jgi:two-component system CheB/CheR fusion protein
MDGMTDLIDGQVEEQDQTTEAAEGCGSEGPNSHPCPVVAIGASAGGLEAFQELFRQMPVDTGFAFVLLQHLSPRHETLIPELLAPVTPMPVRTVEDETVIEPNQIYVMPPHGTLTVDDCVLYLSKPARISGRRSPIDRFFRSLAEDQEDEAVAIVLSGTGTDGALGLKAVKERGGLTMVQAPETARYDSMPRGAVLTGAADHILTVEQMPARLVEHQKRLRDGQGGSPERFREEIAGYLGKICAILRRVAGHDFRHYKQSTLVRRVRRRMAESRAASVYDYAESLDNDNKEVEQLFRDLLISVTHFFRDPEAFALLAAKVVPLLFEGKDADGFVRVWIPGCATGEEAYSLAILLREHMATLAAPPQVQIFATDIDVQALETARQALYPEGIASQISPERLERFFVRHGNMYQVSREIRDLCLFSLHNLIADPPFSRLDLVSCRNLLIYLEGDLQKKVISLFHYALRPGGFLFLGPSEMVAGQPALFRTIDKKHRVFQSRDTVTRPPFSFPLSERGRLGIRPTEELQRRAVPRQLEVARTFETILLDSYAPACVVVHEGGGIIYFSPRTGRYLEAPQGTPTVNVVDMARKGLRLEIRTALHKAVTSRVTVVHENVAFELDGGTQRVNVIVRPMPELGEDPGLFMIVFQEVVTAAGGAHFEALPGEIVADDPIVRRLEAELRSTKDHLQATLEELESSNEELVSSNEELLSMNEELQSANEELQTSKEELQSVNEELETVNAELKKKLDELDRANGDLQNLFQSTRLATVFVDRELRIKKFTPAAVEVFRLIDGDVGRPVADIAPRFQGGDLVEEIREVLRTLSTRERQVPIEENGAWYLLRILPYRTVEDVIDGVVLTFLDITELKQQEEQRETLAAIVDSSQDGIIGKTLDGVITSWNAGAERLYGYSAREAIGRTLDLLVPPDQRPLMAAVFDQLRQGIKVEPFETVRLRKNGERFDISLTFSPVRDSSGRLVGASGIERDITELKRAKEDRETLAAIVDSSQDGIIGKTLDGVITSWNAGAERMYGYSAHEAIGRTLDLIVPPDQQPLMAAVFDQLRQGIKVEPFETVRLRKNGERFDISLTFSPVRDSSGRLLGASGIERDISDRKRAEAELQRRTEQLVEADRRKDEFLAMLGHELRNPLAPIRSCLHLLQSPHLTEEQERRALRTIGRQVFHLTRLVDDLLDIARVSRGKILLRRERLDLVETVRAMVEDQRHDLEDAGLAIDLDLPAAPLWVEGDPTRISQMVGNVMNNAGKFTEPGGRITFAVRELEPGTATVVVRDTGIGMEPELLARAFEPFSQAERGPDRGRGGLGLGLALVKALIEMHGGAVEAESPGPGGGTTVTLRLPLAAETSEETAMAAAASEGARPRRCLIIEDNVDAAESLSLLLQLTGHESDVAFDGSAGVEKARSFRPEVVLCDIGLPGNLDGYGVARAFRADPELRSAFLIALTGYGQEEDRRRALEAGFDTHLTKPADLDALRQLLYNSP